MFYMPHIMLGLVIAYFVKQPLLVAVLAFISHFILDAIPHWDIQLPRAEEIPSNGIARLKEQLKPAGREVIIASALHVILVIPLLIFIRNDPRRWLYVLAGIFAILPDLYENLAVIAGLPSIHPRFTYRHISWKISIPMQAGIVLLCLIIIL